MGGFLLNKDLIVFSDLDGTLLNHSDYSYKDALPALNYIKDKKIPLIITTSKTRAEVEELLNELSLNEPFIVENGGGIFFPEKYRNFNLEGEKKDGYVVIKLGVDYSYIRSIFQRLKKRFPVKGFGDMSVSEISKLTDLPAEKAVLAKKREFSEPFIIEDKSLLPELESEVSKYSLKITKGGRFYHLIGKSQDKGKAVLKTAHIFFENSWRGAKTVGIGDSENDFPMLKVVDIPVLIKKETGEYADIHLPNLIKSTYPGSKGWNEVFFSIIKRYNLIA